MTNVLFPCFLFFCSACSLTPAQKRTDSLCRWPPEISTTSLNQVEELDIKSLAAQRTFPSRRRADLQRRARVWFQEVSCAHLRHVPLCGRFRPAVSSGPTMPTCSPEERWHYQKAIWRTQIWLLTLTSCRLFIDNAWSICRLL